MYPDLAQLFALQQVDTATAHKRRALAALDDGSAKQAELDAAVAERERREEALTELDRRRREREDKLRATEQKREESRQKALVSMETKQQQALYEQIEALTRAKGTFEEELLVLFDEIDERRQERDAQTAVVQRLQREHQRAVTEYEEEKAALEADVARLQAEREAVLPGINPAGLELYEARRKRTGDLAVVATEEGVCTGCNVAVPVVIRRKALRSAEAVQCESCKRILYVTEAEFADETD